MHLASSASQPDFSLVPEAAKHPLTDADFIILTLSLRTKFEVTQRTFFSTQPKEFFEKKTRKQQKKQCKPIDELFYPVKVDIFD